jgi:hypothetical protein
MTSKQLNAFAEIERFIRHVRNLHEIGPHEIRAEAVEANALLEQALGKDYDRIFKTKAWKQMHPITRQG